MTGELSIVQAKHLEAWRAAGISQAAYCRENDINTKTFSSWIKKEGNKAPEKNKKRSKDASSGRPSLKDTQLKHNPSESNTQNYSVEVELPKKGRMTVVCPSNKELQDLIRFIYTL